MKITSKFKIPLEMGAFGGKLDTTGFINVIFLARICIVDYDVCTEWLGTNEKSDISVS